MFAGLGATFGCLLGAGIAAGITYTKSDSQTESQVVSEAPAQETAPGVLPGAAAGSAALLYYFFIHNAFAVSLQETRKQIIPPARTAVITDMNLTQKILGRNAKNESSLTVLARHFKSAAKDVKPSDYGLLALLGSGLGFSMTLAAMTIALNDEPLRLASYAAPAGAAGIIFLSLAYDLTAAARNTWKEIGWVKIPQPPEPPAPKN